jgi:YD repeat-containing protein
MAPIANEPASLSQFNASNNRLTTLAGMAINFDLAGNQLIYPTPNVAFGLEYDAENRNTTVKVFGNLYTKYSYDGDGRRVKKEIANGATTYYVYNA